MRTRFFILSCLLCLILTTCSTLMDFESPKIRIISPAPGSQAFGIVHIQVEATDNMKIDHIELILDGTKTMSAQSGSLAYNWDLTKTNQDANHTILVKAFDSGGNWSEAMVEFFGYGKPPSAPVLSSPVNANASNNSQPLLKWIPVPNAQAYHLQVGKSQFTQLSVNDSTLTGSQYEVSLLDATYSWRVRSRYNEGNWSDWSEVWNFSISTIPSAPSLLSPLNGSIDISTNPTLSWNSVSGASSYGLQVSTNQSFVSLVIEQSEITGTSYPTSSLSEGIAYYWRVNATGSGGTSGWSGSWSFTTSVSPPSVPPLSSPTNGATGASTTPMLSWNGVSGASSYGLQVSTNSGFTSLLVDQSGITAFSHQVSDLSEGTTYYWHVNATGPGGTSGWSDPWNFTTGLTHETSTMTGNDGKIYQTVKIGNQWWMAENLQETKYRNGNGIPNITDNSTWALLSTGAICAYDNSGSKANIYGYLYNWYAVSDSRNIAPTGWHMPTDVEWQILVDYLGGESVAGGKMKEVRFLHWASPNVGATNESGFSALPGGWRNGSEGSFHDLGHLAHFWSATELNANYAWYRVLSCYYSYMNRDDYDKRRGFSVRLLKDN